MTTFPDELELLALLELAEPPPWHAGAACRGAGAEAFFPGEGTGRSTGRARAAYAQAAERYCERCPVRAECAATGATETFGLWGGLSPAQRSRRSRGHDLYGSAG